jgi:hypothetical protein
MHAYLYDSYHFLIDELPGGILVPKGYQSLKDGDRLSSTWHPLPPAAGKNGNDAECPGSKPARGLLILLLRCFADGAASRDFELQGRFAQPLGGAVVGPPAAAPAFWLREIFYKDMRSSGSAKSEDPKYGLTAACFLATNAKKPECKVRMLPELLNLISPPGQTPKIYFHLNSGGRERDIHCREFNEIADRLEGVRGPDLRISSMEAAFWRDHPGGAVIRLEIDKQRLQIGDRLSLSVKLNRPGYLALIWVDGEGAVAPLHPWRDFSWASPQAATPSAIIEWPFIDAIPSQDKAQTVETVRIGRVKDGLQVESIYAFASEREFDSETLAALQACFTKQQFGECQPEPPEDVPQGPFTNSLDGGEPQPTPPPPRMGQAKLPGIPEAREIYREDPGAARHALVIQALAEIPCGSLPRQALTFVCRPSL